MKKFFKRFFILACMISLLSTPAISHAATVEEVISYENFTQITYSPYDLLIINPGTSNRLANITNNGNWYFEAGSTNADVYVNLIMPADFDLIIYKVNSGIITTEHFTDCSGVGLGFGALLPSNGDYMIILRPTGSTAVIVDNFAVWH